MYNEQNELRHYGVVGMKWGVRKNPSRAYAKSTIKREKLEKKVYETEQKYNKATIKANSGKALKYKKAQAKADKFLRKANKKSRGLLAEPKKAGRYLGKSNKYQKRADKYKTASDKRDIAESKARSKYLKAYKKSTKWNRVMDKTFNEISEEDLKRGKELLRSMR